jgi:uncharacterized protein YbaP (TraB family)
LPGGFAKPLCVISIHVDAENISLMHTNVFSNSAIHILLDVSEENFISRIKKGTKISDLAGTWKMSDEEAVEMEAAIEKSWENWRTADCSTKSKHPK